MAKVGIFEEAPKKWFTFCDTDTEVLIQYVDKEALSKLIKRAGEVAKKLSTPQGVAYDMFLGKAAVHGWRKEKEPTQPGFTMPNGSPLPFTAENRNLLMTRYREFSEFVYQKATATAGYLVEDQATLTDDPATLEKLLEDYEETDAKN